MAVSEYWTRGWMSPSGRLYAHILHITCARQLLHDIEGVAPEYDEHDDIDVVYTKLYNLGYCRLVKGSPGDFKSTLYVNIPLNTSVVTVRRKLIKIAKQYNCGRIMLAHNAAIIWEDDN